MKKLLIPQCIINTILLSLVTIKVIEAEKYIHLIIVALFAFMLIAEWWMTIDILRKKNDTRVSFFSFMYSPLRVPLR